MWVYGSAGLQVYKAVGLCVCDACMESETLQICGSSGLRVFGLTGLRVYRSASLRVLRVVCGSIGSIGLWVCRSAGLWIVPASVRFCAREALPARIAPHEGPIRRNKRGNILMPDQ